MAEFMRTGKLQDVELWLTQKSGGQRILLLNATAVRNESGDIVRSRSILRDITEQKASEQTVRTQLAELQRWQAATLGREGRIQELKREVNRLQQKLDGTIEYSSEQISEGDDADVPARGDQKGPA